MGRIKVFSLLFAISCIFPLTSNAQFDGITFKDSVYAATRVHFFIPQKISNTDTSNFNTLEGFASVEWRENGQVIDPESTVRQGAVVFRHEFTGTGSFDVSLEMIDTSGLSYFVSKTILVDDQVEVPNVFSPDDDGINDIFIVKSGGTTRLSLQIYTRNGDLIHEKIGRVVYWDGRLASGNYAKPGVYYYVVASKGSSTVLRKGFFHLFR